MPLIHAYKKVQNELIKLSCPSDLLNEIHQYCTTFHIEKSEEFFVQAAQYILNHDKDWNRLKKTKEEELK